jgi:cytidyltransferase-like protein
MLDTGYKKIVIVSGYFNPLHKGHIEYFVKSKSLGDYLLVIVNSDLQRELKNSKFFQDEEERMLIVSNLKMVDEVVLSIDRDRTQIETLIFLQEKYGSSNHLIFANGGDQTNETIPESFICNQLGIELIDGLGNKIQSSSWLLK